MRILFMGTSQFAVPTLRTLIESPHEVVGVVTQPDRPKGRGRGLSESPVKRLAAEAGIPVHQPEKVSEPSFVELVRALQPEAIVVAAFGQIIPPDVLDIPRYGSVNVHASLLPKYRGAAPVHHALFNGETNTGVTTMLMDAGLDTGPILLQEAVEVLPDENEGSLEARLADVGARLLTTTLQGLEQGTIEPIPQDPSRATRAPSVSAEDCRINWASPATVIVNRVRGCTPKPGAFTSYAGLPVKVWLCRAAALPGPATPGEVVALDKGGILVAAGESGVLLLEVQPRNRNRMAASAFANGYRVAVGSRFE